LDEMNPHNLWFRDFLIGLWQSTPTNLGPKVNTFAHEGPGGLTPDGLSLFLNSDRTGWPFDIWVVTRATTDDDWGIPQKLGEPINTNFWDGVPSLSADGLSLYFSSDRPGGYGGLNDIWLATRKTLRDSWGTPVNLGESVNSAGWDWTTCLSADGLSLYFGSDRQGGQGELDIWITRRTDASEPWAKPENLGETINSPYRDITPLLWANDLILFFTSERPGGYGKRDIWVTTRKTKDAKWGTPMNLGPPINSSNWDQLPIISPNSSFLYFSSNRPGAYGGNDIWQVPILPVPTDLKQDSDTDSLVESDKGED